MSSPVLEIIDIEKRYQGLRPLRMQSLTLAAGERVALLGLDGGASEVLVNLVIPDHARLADFDRYNEPETSARPNRWTLVGKWRFRKCGAFRKRFFGPARGRQHGCGCAS